MTNLWAARPDLSPATMLLSRKNRLFNQPRSANNRRSGFNFNTSHTGIVKNDFLLNDDTTGGTRQQNPVIAVNNFGNIIIAWTDFRDGNADIYLQRMDTNNNFIGNNLRANTDATMLWQGSPAVALHDNGNFAVAWEDRRTYNSDVYLQRFNAQAQFVGDNIVVNDNIGSSDQRNCDIAILPNQEIVVVWDDWRNDWGDIYLQRFSAAGNRIGTNLRVNNDQVGNTQYHPSIDYDSNGNFVVCWMDGRSGNWDIYAQIYNNQVQPVGTNFLVNDNNSNNQTQAKIAVHTDGSFIIVWQDERNNNTDIFSQRFDNLGNRLGNNFIVNDDINNANQASPNIIINNLGNFLVVWTDTRLNNPDIYAQLYNSNGTALDANFKINDDQTSYNQGAPDLAVIASNKYWLVWDDSRNNNNSDIYLQRLNANMTFIGVNQKINDDFASAHQRCSWLTTDGQGNSVAVWEDERNTNCNIYAVRFDSLGNISGNNFKANSDNLYAHYYPSVAANFNGDFIITWCDNRNGDFDIYAQRYNQNGTVLENNFRVNDDLISAVQWYPVVSCDSLGNFVIVWTDYRNNNYDIYCQLYDYAGNPLGNNFIISDNTQSEQLYATVSRNRSGSFVITWMDNRNDNYDIYAQRYNAAGQPIGTDILVNDTTNANYQGYPNLTTHNDGKFIIVWEDQRHYDTDIFLQRFNSDGSRQDSNIRVNTDIYNEEQYSPSVSIAVNSSFAVVWCYECALDDDPEIYAQSFNAAGQRIGNNLMVNQLDFFPANNQWLIGQGISAFRNQYNFAWIDNRRHQGWDIYAKIVSQNFFTGISENMHSEINSLTPLKIYPNPSYGRIFIDYLNRVDNLKIYSSTGQIIKPWFNRRVLDLSRNKPGVYFIQYETDGIKYINKIILVKRS